MRVPGASRAPARYHGPQAAATAALENRGHMLDARRLLASALKPPRGRARRLTTPWGDGLDPSDVLGEHPRPTERRDAWSSLNGWWGWAVRDLPEGFPVQLAARPGDIARTRAALAALEPPERADGRILVPFSPEAPLSSVGRALRPGEVLWYLRSVGRPDAGAGERVLLHFEAVDWMCALRVNGEPAGTHQGAYTPFDVDITPHLGGSDRIELALAVLDPGDAGWQLRGKQSLRPGGIWYTAQSGIWQAVWLEVVPESHLEHISFNGAADGTLRAEMLACAPVDAAGELEADIVLRDPRGDRAGAWRVGLAEVPALPRPAPSMRRYAAHVVLRADSPRTWSPDDPCLYDVEVRLRRRGRPGGDAMRGCCGFRTVEVAPGADGRPRFMLNGRPLFLRGVLDQGYWPDGLMTAPSDEALAFDIGRARAAGFNMVRKHIKVESARWYWHCDRMGMLVWQDMPSGGGTYGAWTASRRPTLFPRTWDRTADDTDAARRRLSSGCAAYRDEWRGTARRVIRSLAGHPSVVTWVLFNEGWGQFDAREEARRARLLDPTRPVDATSGWYDRGAGDYLSRHNYFRPLRAEDGRGRASVLSEFGGLALAVPGHVAFEGAYGYGEAGDARAWGSGVADELARAAALEREGLAGFVYTQLSDVECEVNGIMTYDRRVNKLDGAGGL